MSETSRTEDSAPSLSSYPPAFVSLITTFVKRAEEAESRAHKTLVILRAKDHQVLQLQQRTEVLEKIASRLEEVMVPPLDLPPSPETSEGGDTLAAEPKTGPNNVPLETLFERYPNQHQPTGVAEAQEVHDCYARCQHLIDGLERSNCQLREALRVEGERRVRDHQQYLASLTTSHDPHRADRFCASLFQEAISILGDGDFKGKSQMNQDNSTRMALVDEEDFKHQVNLAESIIKAVQKRLGKAEKETVVKRSKGKQRSKIELKKLSRSTITSYHTATTSSGSFSLRPKYRSLHCFFTGLKRKHRKLKMKYQHIHEKFKESLRLCGKLQEDLLSLKEQKNLRYKGVEVIEKHTQTEKLVSPEKPQSSRSVNLLQGRLDAAAKVMVQQHKQIQDLRGQLTSNLTLADSLRKRLSRAEATTAGKELLGETNRRQLQDLEDKNSVLAMEVQQLKQSTNQLKLELTLQKEVNNNVSKQKETDEKNFEEMKSSMKSKLCSLSSALKEQEDASARGKEELETQLSCLRQKFVVQVTEARDRLIAADSKIQELYLGIETFLKLVFSLQGEDLGPELSPASQTQAVQVASDILHLPPTQIQTFLHSSRCNNYTVNKWIKECNRLVHNSVFAKDLGHLLLDAVLEARLS